MPVYYFKDSKKGGVVSLILSFKEYDSFQDIYLRVRDTLKKGEMPELGDLEFLSSRKVFVDGSLLERVFDPAAIIFKAGGFYTTDNRPKKKEDQEHNN